MTKKCLFSTVTLVRARTRSAVSPHAVNNINQLRSQEFLPIPISKEKALGTRLGTKQKDQCASKNGDRVRIDLS